MTAFLSTSKGKVVRAPAFILQCRNCEGPLRVDVQPKLETRTAYTVTMRCADGCGIDESFVIEPKVKARGGA